MIHKPYLKVGISCKGNRNTKAQQNGWVCVFIRVFLAAMRGTDWKREGHPLGGAYKGSDGKAVRQCQAQR